MDLLNLIRWKVADFDGTKMHEGLKAVVHHVEIAERHFDDGAKYEDYFYTDVIYRTNPAFERNCAKRRRGNGYLEPL